MVHHTQSPCGDCVHHLAGMVHETRDVSRHGRVDVDRLVDAEYVTIARDAHPSVLLEESIGEGRSDQIPLVLNEHLALW